MGGASSDGATVGVAGPASAESFVWAGPTVSGARLPGGVGVAVAVDAGGLDDGLTVGEAEPLPPPCPPPPFPCPPLPPPPPPDVGVAVGVGAGGGGLACGAGLTFGAFLEPVCQANAT